ncbi:MAG: hypothetical protein H7315_14105 [Herminiimonas sp.]|nr:hypothetical protein [Herminiimonas sp.]
MDIYDHYEEAKKIAALLAAQGMASESVQILDAIKDGTSGTEIFMILRFRLTPLLNAQGLSKDTKERMRILHTKLDEALQ